MLDVLFRTDVELRRPKYDTASTAARRRTPRA